MQPAKPCAASKKAALASVTRTAVRRSSDGTVAGARRGLAVREQLDGPARPDRPVAEQAADDPPLDRAARRLDPVGGHEVGTMASSLPV